MTCALCGYPTLGDFYIGVPGHPGHAMHSINCGPALPESVQVCWPTHRRRADGSYERLGPQP